MLGERAHHRAVFRKGLTERQKQVIALVARGRTNAEIAAELGISFDTAKQHVSDILTRLNVDTREEAAAAWNATAGRGPVSRAFEGALLFVATKGAALAAITIVVAAVGAGAIAFIATREADPIPVNPGDDGTPVATVPATTPTAPGFGPTLTQDELDRIDPSRRTPSPTPTQMPALSAIAGVTVQELTVGDPVDLPGGVILFVNSTCYGCEGALQLRRVYTDSGGTLRIDSIVPPAAANPRGSGQPYIAGFANAGPDLLFATVCTGYCGGIADPEPGSTLDLYRSRDGGVTWQLVATDLPLNTFLVGAGGGEALLGTFTAGEPWVYRWYPEGRLANPLAAGIPLDASPSLTGLFGLAWEPRTSGAQYGDVTLYSNGGTRFVLPAPGEPRVDWHLGWRSGAIAWPTAYWVGQQWNYRPTYIAATDTNSGTVQAAFRTTSTDIRISGSLPDGRLIANALLDDARYSDTPIAAFFPVIIDLAARTIRPINGLPPLELTLGAPFTFTRDVFAGIPLRVATGGDCLNVRTQPSTSSPSVGCYPDGVLLRAATDADLTGEWIRVFGPDGVGWAASAFLVK